MRNPVVNMTVRNPFLPWSAMVLALACKTEPRPDAMASAPRPREPPAATAPRAGTESDWNGAQIAWQDFDGGLALAARERKPICLVISTTWCPHCIRYSHVFSDPRVVAASKSFVMIHVDKDKNPAISQRFAPDGEYIPRTFFLSSAGTLLADIHAPRPNYRYFYDEHAPDSVLQGFAQAKQLAK
jgi:hypothetical protein